VVGALSVAEVLQGTPGVRVVRRPFEPKDEVIFAEGPPPPVDAKVVEGASLRSIAVPKSDGSEFTHFVDGVQKSRLAFFDGPMPGYLGDTSAAVLVREEGEIRVSWAEEAMDAPQVFAPASSDALHRLAEAGFRIQPVPDCEDAGMSEMMEKISARIGTVREEMETRLKVKWLREGEGWLLADGGIAQAAAALPSRVNIVGVVKSHRRQYFKNGADVVLGLKEGERTPVFEARTGSHQQDVAYSWYLRLRDESGESPAFGLIRVEMPPISDSIEWADRVSSWLMAECAPLSLPDVRYDRMVYPIRRVELYLKSKQPSDSVLTGIVGRW
jgi:hypothetical protein